MIILSAVIAQDTINLKPKVNSAVCHRNSFEYLSLSDNQSFLKDLQSQDGITVLADLFERSSGIRTEMQESLRTGLKSGLVPPANGVRTDFVITILLAAVFLLTIVRASVKNFQPVKRFFLFKGLNDSASSDTGVIFHWQTTLLNLMSFCVISLFAFQAASISNIIPGNLNGALFWSICLLLIVSALTVRHFICYATGNLSGQREVFNEYLVGIYQSYHFTALIFFILIVLATYTGLISSKAFIIAGFCVAGIMYLIRVARLLLIFLKRNISIFYLILYLCALEILPVAIIIRYFSDAA